MDHADIEAARKGARDAQADGGIAESAAPGFEPGTRYTGNPLITCGTRDWRVQGRNNLCAQRTMVGMTRPGSSRGT